LKLQLSTDLDSDDFVAEANRIRGKKNPHSAAVLKSLRDDTPAPSNRPARDAAKPCNSNAN
jgi:hypothetical protein